MNKIQYFFTAVLLMFICQSCYYDELTADSGVLPTNVSFSNDVQRIFNINCVSCHNGTLAPNLTSGNSFNALINGNYVIPFDANNSDLMNSLLGNGAAIMPPSGALSQADINKISQWINEGALNN